MTVEKLKERLAELEKMFQQAVANVNALDGARQELTSWLNSLQNDEKSLDNT